MFKTSNAFCSYSVDDVEKAKKFYGDTLGLEVEESPRGLELRIGAGRVFLYPKPNHTPASFTILNFPVTDVEKSVDELTKRGVQFEVFTQGDIQTDEKGIFRGHGPKIAWFRDPAGNYLSVLKSNG